MANLSTSIHSAQAPYLGYRFEPFYALIVLWNESVDDLDEVYVEADDDIVLKGRDTTKLYQLKHSTNRPSSLTIKNDGFWKTIRIWSQFASIDKHELFFVTNDTVSVDSPLEKLVKGKGQRQDIVDLMAEEAQRVIDIREAAVLAKAETLSFETKIHGCQSFMGLSPEDRLSLIDRITIRSNNFHIFQVYSEVIKKLEDMVGNKLRSKIANRLLEWWDMRSLDPKQPIRKAELLFQLQSLIGQFQDNNLPDDYSKQTPISLEPEFGGFMEKQIDLVNGGFSRKKRAALARWRARNQREKWITDDILNVFELDEYDSVLQEAWSDRYGPMQDDLLEESESLCKKKGLELLEWVHSDAHLHINPIRSEWKQHFLIHGSYQQMAEELKVGWHPKFKEMLSDEQ
ncbi:ABC-three component system protein [Paenibacillus sp. FSL P2-0136]|uniref:ABC-three component system protein n=1 Tax=Paenibacillus sp. FSL P2-0136 TaxID=2975317 RepID=UPI0030DD09E3